MSDGQNFGFGHFVPGFDFLQNLAKGASGSMPQIPGLSSWIAPTLSVEELDKRISELRAVLFWLEQNQKALGATIQALEVQKMTLNTLKGMDVTLSDLAESLKIKPGQFSPSEVGKKEAAEGAAKRASPSDAASSAGDSTAAAGHVVDPLQWWGSLTQQFQQIATQAMQQAAQNNPVEAAREAASGMAEEAIKAANRMSEAQGAKRPARKTTSTSTAAPRKKAGTKRGSAG